MGALRPTFTVTFTPNFHPQAFLLTLALPMIVVLTVTRSRHGRSELWFEYFFTPHHARLFDASVPSLLRPHTAHPGRAHQP